MRFAALFLILALLPACGTSSSDPVDEISPEPTDETSQSVPATRPADFAIEYGWSTGSLPTQYHRSTRTTIAADGAGVVTHSTEYGQGASDSREFQLSDAEMDTLYTRLRAAGLFRSWTTDDYPPPGSSSWWAEVQVDGQTVTVPTFVAEPSSEKDALEDILRSMPPPVVP